jgi:hypothetical protein
MARARGARTQLAAVFESTYGTSPVSGFRRMPFASETLSEEQPLLDNELLGYGRDPLAPIKDAITTDGDVVVPVDAEAFGFWLKGAFGQPTTTGAGPYTHVFQSGSWTLPSMSIEVGMPDIPDFTMYQGCRVNTLSWTMQRSGLLTATANIMSQGATAPAGSTAAGTPTDYALKRFGHFNGAILRNGSTLANIISAEITYSNNLDPVETIRSDGKVDGHDASMASLTGSIEARFADLTLFNQAIAGTSAELSFGYTLPGGEEMTFVAHAVYLPKPRKEISGPGGIQVRFDWQAALATSPARMCTVTLKNAVATY